MCAVHRQARRILLMAFGENKAGIVAKAVEGPITERVPASFLQRHPAATAFLDVASSSGPVPLLGAIMHGNACWLALLHLHV